MGSLLPEDGELRTAGTGAGAGILLYLRRSRGDGSRGAALRGDGSRGIKTGLSRGVSCARLGLDTDLNLAGSLDGDGDRTGVGARVGVAGRVVPWP